MRSNMRLHLSRKLLGSAGYQRARRMLLVAQDLCAFCREPNDRPGKTECSECRRVHQIKTRKV